jgi:hypothetical protein
MTDRRIEDGAYLVERRQSNPDRAQAPSIHKVLDSSCQDPSSILGPELARLMASIRQSLDRIDKIIATLSPYSSEAR